MNESDIQQNWKVFKEEVTKAPETEDIINLMKEQRKYNGIMMLDDRIGYRTVSYTHLNCTQSPHFIKPLVTTVRGLIKTNLQHLQLTQTLQCPLCTLT